MQCGGFRAYTSLRVRVPTTRHRHVCARQALARVQHITARDDKRSMNARTIRTTRVTFDARVTRASDGQNNAVTCNDAHGASESEYSSERDQVRGFRALRQASASERDQEAGASGHEVHGFGAFAKPPRASETKKQEARTPVLGVRASQPRADSNCRYRLERAAS